MWPRSSLSVETLPSIYILWIFPHHRRRAKGIPLPSSLLLRCVYRIPVALIRNCLHYLDCLCVFVKNCLQFVWTQNFSSGCPHTVEAKTLRWHPPAPPKILRLQTQLYRNYEIKNYLPFLPNTQGLHDCEQDQTRELQQDTRRCSCSC